MDRKDLIIKCTIGREGEEQTLCEREYKLCTTLEFDELKTIYRLLAHGAEIGATRQQLHKCIVRKIKVNNHLDVIMYPMCGEGGKTCIYLRDIEHCTSLHSTSDISGYTESIIYLAKASGKVKELPINEL